MSLEIELTTSAFVEALRDAGVSQSTIASRLALPSSAVSNIFNDKRKLALEEANKLVDLLPAFKPSRQIPVIGMAGAGNWLEAIEDAQAKLTLPGDPHISGDFAVQVVGNSMNLILPEGSRAVIDPNDTDLYTGKLYLLRNAEGEATIKRYRADPARFEPVSDDPSFVPFTVGSTDFRVIGRVTSGIQLL